MDIIRHFNDTKVQILEHTKCIFKVHRSNTKKSKQSEKKIELKNIFLWFKEFYQSAKKTSTTCPSLILFLKNYLLHSLGSRWVFSLTTLSSTTTQSKPVIMAHAISLYLTKHLPKTYIQPLVEQLILGYRIAHARLYLSFLNQFSQLTVSPACIYARRTDEGTYKNAKLCCNCLKCRLVQ